VDDNHDQLDSLSMLLKVMGHDVREAENGTEALKVAEEFRPQVLLVDIGLPEMNGYDVARRVRERPWGRDVLLVAQTGWGQDEDRRRSREAGFDHHLVKPVAPAALEELLRNMPAK
jgi:CheY-like chemotaxis protein